MLTLPMNRRIPTLITLSKIQRRFGLKNIAVAFIRRDNAFFSPNASSYKSNGLHEMEKEE